jgi:antitoxin component YwqK of YwqJK toxin-antitoxin module
MKKLISLGFLSLLFFIGCKGTLTEELTEKYPDGTPKVVHYYNDNGKVKEMVREVQYYPNHNKFYDGEFKDNRKDGKWIVWYQNGSTWSEGFFSKGLDDGKRTGYYENGKKHFEGTYKEGKMLGKWTFWNELGIVVKEIDYTENK